MINQEQQVAASTVQTALDRRFAHEVSSRIEALAQSAQSGAFESAISVLAQCILAGGVIQAFGTGHSEAFAMEIAGRAGGLIPTNRIALRDAVLYGTLDRGALGGSALERNADVVQEIYAISAPGPDDVFVIASNSGVNRSIVGMALLAKLKGHTVIAVTSLDHTSKVEPKHVSGMRLCEVADIVLDNLAPYGDATLELPGGIPVGAVSSITAAYIAQLLTIGTAQRVADLGHAPPLYISANIPAGDEHNSVLEDRYRGRIRRDA